MERRTNFKVDTSKCIGCGNCINVCSGMVLEMKNGTPEMKHFEKFGWHGCWKCQHCLAVCPTGAIEIFNKKPENSSPKPKADMGEQMENLVKFRRSCRRYQKKNVKPEIIDSILSAMENVPTGGNSSSVEYTVIDDIDRVKEIWNIAYNQMEQNAKRGIYTYSFNDFYYRKMKESEKTVRKDDMLFCGAPHLFIAHKRCVGKWGEDAKVDCDIASAYFELLCNAHGLGTTIMSYSSDVIQDNPKAREMLGIPKDHYMKLIIGFGYPEIEYARGVQKERKAKIHRYNDHRQTKLDM